MKIMLPKSLAEPLTIPWEQICHDENDMVQRIKLKLREYMHYLIDNDWTPEANPGNPRFSRESMLRRFRAVVWGLGGLDVHYEYHPITGSNNFVGYAYWIYFKVKKGGRRHSKLFTTDG